MRMRTIGLAVLLIVAGCTTQEPVTQPTQVEYPKVQPPRDRDERAVVAALRQLDACALLDPVGGNRPVARGPHRCAVEAAELGDTVTVTLGVRFDRGHKYRAVPLDLGGAKAYLDTSEPGTDSCRVAIPVSFELAIAAVGRKGPRSGAGDICSPARSAAAVAVTRLANPPSGPATSWTACELLAEIAGDAVLEGDDLLGMDRCRASEPSQDRLGKVLFRVNLDYGGDPTQGAEDVRTIGGQRVAVLSDSSGCSYLWGVVTFHASDCPKGEPLVPKLITILASPNPDRTSPQRPLPMRTDEPDEPLVGACVDYPYSLSCQPSTDMPVPRGAQAALAAAGTDARVACALAQDAVRARFGAAMTPVLGSLTTERPTCYFVEPDHTTVVEVRARPDDDLADAVRTGGGQDVTVAGRPARSASSDTDRSLCVLPVSGAETGLLCLVAHFFPGRGKESDAPADASRGAQLEPALTDIVSKYFA
jgi:hypothetical protein